MISWLRTSATLFQRSLRLSRSRLLHINRYLPRTRPPCKVDRQGRITGGMVRGTFCNTCTATPPIATNAKLSSFQENASGQNKGAYFQRCEHVTDCHLFWRLALFRSQAKHVTKGTKFRNICPLVPCQARSSVFTVEK
jgi:hypothetical protein